MSVQRLKLWLAPPAWRWLECTVRIEPDREGGGPRAAPVIFACLHRDIIPALLYVRSRRPVLLVSLSPDGDILVRTLGPRGFGFARGSTGPTGGGGFQRLVAALAEGRDVGLAVDGPRGPFGVVRDGVVQLSRRSGCPIVPLTAAPRRCWRLRNWDGTVVPLPGSRCLVREGPPLQVPAGGGEDNDHWNRRVAEALGAGPGARKGDG